MKKYAIFAIGCILLLLAGLFLYTNKSKFATTNLNNNDEEVSTILTESGKELSGISNIPAKVAPTILWWDTPEGYSILTEVSSSTYVPFMCGADSQAVQKLLPAYSPKIEKIFKAYGFTKNISNSSADYKDDKFYDYVEAYEQNGVRCTVTTNPDCYSYDTGEGSTTLSYQSVEVACVKDADYQKAYNEQYPLLRDLGLKETFIHDIRYSGNGKFLIANINFRRTGAYIIAAKNEQGKWEEVHGGQDIPSCDIIFSKKIPSDITPLCWSEKDKKEIKNTIQ